jgi:phosphoglycerate dehydrogenase-like enzyme
VRAVILEHVFHDLAPERAVLELRGVEVVDGTGLDGRTRRALAETADALLVQYSTLDGPTIAALKHCQVIGSYGVGYDQIDVAAATAP